MEHENWVSDTKELSEASVNNSCQNFDVSSSAQSPQINSFEALNALPNLGLQLTPTPSFLDEVEQILSQRGYNNVENQQANNSSNARAVTKASNDVMLQQANRLKAEIFVISSLKIGSWERVSRSDGDLVAKCYFAKRSFVWEFLENGVKSKIEFLWSNILSFKGVRREGQPGTLEIELSQPPTFFHDIDYKPRRHPQWRMTTDFTGGQATAYMRHHLKFPPGVLDRTLEKLSLHVPYRKISFDSGGQLHTSPRQQQQLSFGNVPAPYQTYEPASLYSSLSEYGNNQMPYWEGRGRINNQIPSQMRGTMMPTIPSDAGSSISSENNYTPLSQNQIEELISTQQQPSMFQTLLNDDQNILLNHSQGHNNMINDVSLDMVDNSAGSSMMPTIPSNAGSSISSDNDYTPLSQNQIEELISTQQQPSMFQTLLNDDQNILLNHSQGHNNMINDVSLDMVDNSAGSSMMPTIPSNAGSSISSDNNYTPLSQNQIEAVISSQQQSSVFQTLNDDDDDRNILLNHSQEGLSKSILEADSFLKEHLGNNMINDVSLVDNSALSNKVVPGEHMYQQLMNWPPDNNSFSSSVNNDDSLNHEIDDWTCDIDLL